MEASTDDDANQFTQIKKLLEKQFETRCVNGHYKRREKCNEIIPGLFVGGCDAATSFECLHGSGITHVLNAAEGTDGNRIMTGHDFYHGSGIIYHGISAEDDESYNLSGKFEEAADFIRKAIGTKAEQKTNEKVLVHCMAGVSRSSTLAAAYLMRDHGMSLTEALITISKVRLIFPNDGFLKSLIAYDKKLGNHA